MKKVAITTLFSVNLGNRLQNYALQQLLREFDLDVFSVYYDEMKLNNLHNGKHMLKIGLGFIGFRKYRYAYLDYRRKVRFDKFNNIYINLGEKIEFTKTDSLNEKYDYFVTGSDQVWHNWHNSHDELRYFYLMFADKKKRLSYAPSLGLSEFPVEDIEVHKKGLSEMALLSCREKIGCQMIFDLIQCDAEWLLDPTMLLARDEWEQIERTPQKIPKSKYVLVYKLGESVQSERFFIEEYAKENQCEVIDVFDKMQEDYYDVTPDEFVYLVHNAEFVFTDSFHATVFSILFHKQFLVFSRTQAKGEKMETRMESLFELFGLENRWYTDGMTLDACKFDDVEDVLEEQKKKTIEYFNKYIGD